MARGGEVGIGFGGRCVSIRMFLYLSKWYLRSIRARLQCCGYLLLYRLRLLCCVQGLGVGW